MSPTMLHSLLTLSPLFTAIMARPLYSNYDVLVWPVAAEADDAVNSNDDTLTVEDENVNPPLLDVTPQQTTTLDSSMSLEAAIHGMTRIPTVTPTSEPMLGSTSRPGVADETLSISSPGPSVYVSHSSLSSYSGHKTTTMTCALTVVLLVTLAALFFLIRATLKKRGYKGLAAWFRRKAYKQMDDEKFVQVVRAESKVIDIAPTNKNFPGSKFSVTSSDYPISYLSLVGIHVASLRSSVSGSSSSRWSDVVAVKSLTPSVTMPLLLPSSPRTVQNHSRTCSAPTLSLEQLKQEPPVIHVSEWDIAGQYEEDDVAYADYDGPKAI